MRSGCAQDSDSATADRERAIDHTRQVIMRDDAFMSDDPMCGLIGVDMDSLMEAGQEDTTKRDVVRDVVSIARVKAYEPFDESGAFFGDVDVDSPALSSGTAEMLPDFVCERIVDVVGESPGVNAAQTALGDAVEKPVRKRRRRNAEEKCSAEGCYAEIKLTARNDGDHPLCEKHKRAAVARCKDGVEVCFCFYCNKAHDVSEFTHKTNICDRQYFRRREKAQKTQTENVAASTKPAAKSPTTKNSARRDDNLPAKQRAKAAVAAAKTNTKAKSQAKRSRSPTAKTSSDQEKVTSKRTFNFAERLQQFQMDQWGSDVSGSSVASEQFNMLGEATSQKSVLVRRMTLGERLKHRTNSTFDIHL